MARFYMTKVTRPHDVPLTVRRTLSGLPDNFHVCLQFKLQKDFDVVIFHRKGIYVIEVKNTNRKITEGPARVWMVQTDGNPTNLGNPFDQAVECTQVMKDYLRSKSHSVLKGRSQAEQATFWSNCRIFPFVCVPQWNSNSAVTTPLDHFCLLTQCEPHINNPQFLLGAIHKRDWMHHPKTRNLQLSDTDIANIIEELGLEHVDEATAIPGSQWRSNIDDRARVGFDMGLRSEDLKTIRHHLEQSPMLAIVGEPQVGKTSVVQRLSTEFVGEGRSVLYHDFRLDSTSIMLERFLEKTRTPIQAGIDDNISAFLLALMDQKWIVVLDNFESAVDSVDLSIKDKRLSRLLERLHSSVKLLKSYVLFTSRYSILAQHGSKIPEMTLGGLNHQDGVRYLQDVYAWSESQAEAIYAIRVGHPHVMHLISVDIKNKMQLGLDFTLALIEINTNAINLYSDVYHELTEMERSIVEIAALHPSGVPIRALQWLKSTGLLNVNLDAVIRLHHKGAISKSGMNTVQLLPSDQAYVYSIIKDIVSRHDILVSYYKTIVESHDASEGQDVEEDYQRLFYHALKAQSARPAWEAVFSYGWRELLQLSGRHDTLVTLCTELCECNGFADLSSEAKADLWYTQGASLWEMGRLDAAGKALNLAESGFASAGRRIKQANAIAELGLVSRKRGERGNEEAAYYEIALELLSEEDTNEMRRVRSKILARQAKASEREGGNPETILANLEESLLLARQIADHRWVAHRLGQLGSAYRDILRDYRTAERYIQEALATARSLRDNASTVAALAGLGSTYEKSRKFDVAEQYYREALAGTIASDVYGMLDRLGRLAHVTASLRRYSESEEYYSRAITLSRQVDNKKAEAENLDGLGAVFRTQAYGSKGEGRARLLKKAWECHSAAVCIQETLSGEPIGLVNRYQELGRTLLAMKECVQARNLFLKALRALSSAQESPRVRYLRGWQFMRLGESLECERKMEDAVVCYAKANDDFGNKDRQEQEKGRRRCERIMAELDLNTQSMLNVRISRLQEEAHQLLDKLLSQSP